MASKASAKPQAAGARPLAAVTKRETSTNNYIAIVGVITLLIVLAGGFVSKSLIGSIILDGKLILHANQAKGDLDTKLQNIPQLIDNYNALGSNRQQLLTDALPTAPNFPALITIAQAMSADSGVTLKSVAPQAASGSTAAAGASGGSVAGASAYSFSVEIAGSYPQIIHFFTDVQQSIMPMKVVSTQITGGGGELDVTTTIQTYYAATTSVADQTEPLK